MGKIVRLPNKNDVLYYIDAELDTFTVSPASCDGVTIGLEDGHGIITLGGSAVSFTREQLARLLWAAAYAVDSNQKWAEGEYPARNY